MYFFPATSEKKLAVPIEADEGFNIVLASPPLGATPTSHDKSNTEERRKLELALLQARIEHTIAQKRACDAEAEYKAALTKKIKGDQWSK